MNNPSTSTTSTTTQQDPVKQMRKWIAQQTTLTIEERDTAVKYLNQHHTDILYDTSDKIKYIRENLLQPTTQVVTDIRKYSLKDIKCADYPFLLRDNYKKLVVENAFNNYTHRGGDTTQKHKFIFITGDSGIGKTRAGFEASRIIDIEPKYTDTEFINAIKDPVYLYLNLSSGCKFNYILDSPHLQEGIGLGVRVAYSSGMYGDLNKKPFDSIDEIIMGGYQHELSFTRVIEDIFQEYITQHNHRVSPSGGGGNSLKNMLAIIGQYMQSRNHCFIIPKCTGTSDNGVDFMKSGYGNTSIILKPLTLKSCEKIIKKVYDKDSPQVRLLDDLSFQIAISDTGCIPKDLNYLLDKVYSDDYSELCYRDISALNRAQDQDPNDLYFLCSRAIVNAPITLTTVLLSGKTINDMRIRGFIYLVPLSDSSVNVNESENITEVRFFRIYLSFYNLKSFNLKSSPQCFPDGLLLLPTKLLQWQWQHFEKLYPFVQLCLFDAIQPKTIKSVFRGVEGLDQLSHSAITGYPDRVLEESKKSDRWLTYTHGNYKHHLQTCRDIVICHQNEPIIDHRFAVKLGEKTVFVFIQAKHSKPDVEDPNLDDPYKLMLGSKKLFNQVDTEVQEDGINNSALVYLLVTNRLTTNCDLITEFNDRKAGWQLNDRHYFVLYTLLLLKKVSVSIINVEL
ncbi:hypothetical protein SAMD00019534_020570 [Acytostelium subglobosum LB1]|uniref:hypothetical protein n=1 Tax=Acytostelium subglobosum LB1 TaxID=1410327 RepID=UPI000644D55B|nr:hypothetical protein SAMD00019534_020570 [Acytostelium subglobosum LB1]GAM18882.1 hypothetical protein SAMD00019534_020570 [Acytostelium subglobosum LB1]|eukprot:XP_012758102.1 hypothetical protein SAMD00019534_020570 [Acytostelium subglobosum LB1]